MNNEGVKIRYGDVAPEAKENFTPSVTDKAEFVNLEQLQQYNLHFPNYGNPCELYSVVLDGNATVFPDNPETESLGLWSEQISNADGTFTEPIVLTLTSSGQYSSQGFTLTFDIYNNIFCNSLNIKWYRNDELLNNIDYIPDNAFYFCRQWVENYDKVVITFNSINMPYNRLKLRVIDYGYGTYFYSDELRNVKLIQEIDPISSEISINTCDFTLDSNTDMEYSFQAKQPLSVYFNGELKATTFVKTSKRTAKRLWSIQSEDYIGMLENIPYAGGIYAEVNAVELLEDIFYVAKVPYNISGEFADKTLTGYIPYTTCREALMQVAFAIGAVVDTSNSDKIEVYTLSSELSQSISLERIMQGQAFTDDETVTAVELAFHTYTAIDESVEAYNASESGTGENILVKFSEPLHDLTISKGTILASGSNYALINADSSCTVSGCKYEHNMSIKQFKNPVVLASEIDNVVTIEDATLVSSTNVDELLEKCYNWLTKTSETNLDILERKDDKAVNVGNLISYETEYLGTMQGRVIKESFNLNGGNIVKGAAVK